jgi:CHAD domain-containing protein
MKKKEIREFLYRVFRKVVASFLANIYKAGITGNSRDIHRARLDVKKIFALFRLFEMLEKPESGYESWYRFFRPLYRQAGKIREIQVDYIMLGQLDSHAEDFQSFLHWLKRREQVAIRKFIYLVKKIEEDKLKHIEKAIFNLCQGRGGSISSIRSKTGEFIMQNAILTRKLQADKPGDDEIHRIRKLLKEMSIVATLVYSLKPGKGLDQIVTGLNKTEMMIGDWHDRVVLKEAIEKFLSENAPPEEKELASLNQLKQNLQDQCQNLVIHFMPEVDKILQVILEDTRVL